MAARSAPRVAHRRGGVAPQRCRAPAAAASATPAATSAAQPSSPLPATFRRLVAPRTGGSLREVASVLELPLPTPGPGEVLLRVRYAGVNGGCETFRARGEHWFAGNAKKSGASGPLLCFASGCSRSQARQAASRWAPRARARLLRRARACSWRWATRSPSSGCAKARGCHLRADADVASSRALFRSLCWRPPCPAGACRRRRQRPWPAPSAA